MHFSHLIATLIAIVAFSMPTMADVSKNKNERYKAVSQKSKTTSLTSAYRNGYIVKKRKYPTSLISRARRSDDEISECMANPANSHIPHIERLGACFCLAINNANKACQKSDTQKSD